jgi:FecR protein
MMRSLLVAIALAAPGLASGEQPERVARLSYVEGEITFRGAQQVAPSALPDRPLEAGDRLSTARDGRAELSLGNATLRLDEDTAITVDELGASAVRIEVAAGTASLHLRELFEGESYELITPNTTVAFRAPGEYRVDITPGGATDLTVRAGNAEVATAGGPVRVADGQRVRLEGRAEFASLVTPRAADEFDDWVLERELQLAEAAPPVDESSEYYEDEALDEYGEWRDDPGYGRVWMPSYAYGGYDPFSYGHWQYNGYGYAWYDPMPWSAYTSHHGRWVRHQDRWCWVPDRRGHGRHVANDTPSRALPLPFDGDRRPTLGRDSDTGKKSRGGTMVPREASPNPPRRIDANRAPVFQRGAEPAKPTRTAAAPRSAPQPPRAAPAAQGSSTPTLRPSRPANSSNAGSSGSSSNSSSQAASRPATTTSKGFAKPQEP